MHAMGVIPARYGSTRLAGKPLAMINGKPMVQHVYENARRASTLASVVVATDDERVVNAVAAFGGEAVMTSAAHRLRWVFRLFCFIPFLSAIPPESLESILPERRA